MKLREELRTFVQLQEKVLQDNDHKFGWKDVPNSQLLSLLKLEIKELEEALLDGCNEDISWECADVANYAMMIADNNWELIL